VLNTLPPVHFFHTTVSSPTKQEVFHSILAQNDLEDHFDELWKYGVKSAACVSKLKEADREALKMSAFEFRNLQDAAAKEAPPKFEV
jgi:hypothetical protein